MLSEYAAWVQEPSTVGRMSRWKQTYLVVTACRILDTIREGGVATKREALAERRPERDGGIVGLRHQWRLGLRGRLKPSAMERRELVVGDAVRLVPKRAGNVDRTRPGRSRKRGIPPGPLFPRPQSAGSQK